jgi:hypothetical protein
LIVHPSLRSHAKYYTISKSKVFGSSHVVAGTISS